MPSDSEPSVDANAAQGVTRLQLLGQPQLTRVAHAPPQLLAPGDAALLARLALDGPQAREALAALLWPDNDSARAATNLRQRIYRLKRMAGTSVVIGTRSLSLAANVQHDLRPPEPLAGLDPALGACPLLGSYEYAENEELAAWVATHRERRVQHRVRFLTEGARTLSAQGDMPAALGWAQRLVNEAPLEEPAHRLLIQLLHQSGNTTGAVAAYRRCEKALTDTLGVEPSPAMRALWQQLQASELPAPTAAPALPLALLRPPRLVARSEPWQRMASAAMNHEALVIEGEAGVGKSRLLGDFVASTQGWTLVAASAGDPPLPFALLARMLSLCTARWGLPHEAWACAELARLAPQAGPPASDAFAMLRLQQAVRVALLRWQESGLVGLALDDLHWADLSSLELLLPLVAGSRATGLAWRLTTRQGETGEQLQGLQRLVLPPLPRAAIAELLCALDLPGLDREAWALALLQRAGGNPLFMLQMLTAAFESQSLAAAPTGAGLAAPASLWALLATRLERMSPQARAIARLASVAGPDFTLRLACDLLQSTPAALADSWLELQATHVMRDDRFAHDLIREATAQSTPPAVRQLMHVQVAGALEASHAHAGRVAEHWDAAAHWPQAAAAYEQAAADARSRSAWRDELLKLRAATRCHRASAAPAAQAAAFGTALRAFELRVVNTDLSDDTLREGQALLEQAATEQDRAGVLVVLAYYWAERYEPAPALALAQDALELAHRCAEPRLLLLAGQRMGAALGRLGRHEEAIQTLRPMTTDLTSLSLLERLNWQSEFASVLSNADHRTAALPVFDAVIESASEHGLWAVAAAALSGKALAMTILGRTREGMQAQEDTLALYRRAGLDDESLLIDEATCACNLRDQGHFTAYLQRAEPLPQALRAAGSPFWAANAEHDLATAWAWLGRADLALRTLAGDTGSLPPLMQAARLTTRARLARDFGVGGRSADPRALLQQAAALLQATQPAGPSNLRLAVELHSARDAEPAQGLATATRLEQEALRRENIMLACNASVVRLKLLLDAADELAAAQAATELLAQVEPFGPPAGLYPPELGWLAWQALKHRKSTAARAALTRAAQWLRRTAQEHVPELHRENFLTRNPVNRAILAAARDQGV